MDKKDKELIITALKNEVSDYAGRSLLPCAVSDITMPLIKLLMQQQVEILSETRKKIIELVATELFPNIRKIHELHMRMNKEFTSEQIQVLFLAQQKLENEIIPTFVETLDATISTPAESVSTVSESTEALLMYDGYDALRHALHQEIANRDTLSDDQFAQIGYKYLPDYLQRYDLLLQDPEFEEFKPLYTPDGKSATCYKEISYEESLAYEDPDKKAFLLPNDPQDLSKGYYETRSVSCLNTTADAVIHHPKIATIKNIPNISWARDFFKQLTIESIISELKRHTKRRLTLPEVQQTILPDSPKPSKTVSKLLPPPPPPSLALGAKPLEQDSFDERLLRMIQIIQAIEELVQVIYTGDLDEGAEERQVRHNEIITQLQEKGIEVQEFYDLIVLNHKREQIGTLVGIESTDRDKKHNIINNIFAYTGKTGFSFEYDAGEQILEEHKIIIPEGDYVSSIAIDVNDIRIQSSSLDQAELAVLQQIIGGLRASYPA